MKLRYPIIAVLLSLAAYGGFEAGQYMQFSKDRAQAVAGMCGRYNASSGAFEWVIPLKDKAKQKQAALDVSERAVRVAGR